MRIVFVTTKFDFEIGGGSSPELDLKIRALKELGNEVIAVTTFSQNNRGPQPKDYPVFNEFIGTSGQFAISWGVYRVLKKYESKTDIFQVDGVLFLFGAGLYRLLGGRVPVLSHFNRELPWFPEARSKVSHSLQGWLRFFVEKTLGVFLANHLDAFTFTSPLLHQAYNNFGLSEKKSFLTRDLLDGYAISKKEGIRSELQERRWETKEVFMILCSGRMVWEKGFDIVLKALDAVKDKEKLRLILSGDGPERGNLQKLARELKITDLVSFPGWVAKEKLLEFFREADIFILPRWRPELASMLLFEAMAFGIPSLVPASSTLAWSAGEGAVTFRDQDHLDLAEKISKLIASGELRVEISKRALRRIEELHYSKPAKELNDIMENICK